jgi:hypothetical protein
MWIFPYFADAYVPPEVSGSPPMPVWALFRRTTPQTPISSAPTKHETNKAPYTKFTKEDLKALSENLNEVRSCYMFMIPAEIEALLGVKSENPMYAIVIKNDPVEIKHGLVRVFGYMNAQLSGRLAVDGDFTTPATKVALAKTPNEKFEKTKLKITKAFLDDLKGKSGYSSFEKFGKMPAIPKDTNRIYRESG